MRGLLLLLLGSPALWAVTCTNGAGDAAAIQAALTAGGTVTITGTCSLGGTGLTMGSNVTVNGAATLNYTGGDYIFTSGGNNNTVTGLTLNGGGIHLNNSHNQGGWTITNNHIQNIFTQRDGILVDNILGGTSGSPLPNVVTGNTFTDIWGAPGGYPNLPTGFADWNAVGRDNLNGGCLNVGGGFDHTTVDNNVATEIGGDCIDIKENKIASTDPSWGYTTSGNSVSGNKFTHVRRFEVEVQGISDFPSSCVSSSCDFSRPYTSGAIMKDNYASLKDDITWDTYNYSMVWGASDSQIINNTGNFDNASCVVRPGIALEMSSRNMLVQGNTFGSLTTPCGWLALVAQGGGVPNNGTNTYQNNTFVSSNSPLSIGDDGGSFGGTTVSQFNYWATTSPYGSSISTSNISTAFTTADNQSFPSGGSGTWSSYAISALALKNVSYYLDGSGTPTVTQEIQDVNSGFSTDRKWLYHATFNTSSVGSGTHSIVAKATDVSDAVVSTSTQHFTVGAAGPVVTITGVSFVSHSDAIITFDVSASYDHWRLRWIASPGSCAGGAGGTVMGMGAGGILATSGMKIQLGGAPANTVLKVCPEVTANGGATWSSGAETTVTMLPLPNPHPALPIAPASFDSRYPDTTGCTVVTTTNTCSDLQTKLNTALSVQGGTCTVIQVPTGSVCTGIGQITHAVAAADIVQWQASDVTIGNPGIIKFPLSTFTEGQLVTYGKRYAGFATDPASSSCAFGNGFVDGGKYRIHIESTTSTQNVSLICDDGSNNSMAFSTTGSNNPGFPFEFVPHTLASGMCPSAAGDVACTYQKRAGMKWIVIRSSASDTQLPPDGKRLTKDYCDAGACATIVVPVGASGWFINAGDGDGGNEYMTGNVHWGPGIKFQTAVDPANGRYCTLLGVLQWASDFVMDRVWFSGNPAPQRWSGLGCPGLYMNGFNFALRDSIITDMSDASLSQIDAGGAVLSNGPGPITIYNNYINGAGVTFHFDDGGGSHFIRGDNSIIRNTFFTPISWMHGSSTSDGYYHGERQPLEFKSNHRNLIDGNIFDGQWVEVTPASVFIALTSVDSYGITDTWIRNNSFIHGSGGVNPQIQSGNGLNSPPPNRYALTNNLFTDINGDTYTATGIGVQPGTGWALEGPNGGEDFTIDHNTFVGNTGRISSWFWMFNFLTEGVSVTNNFTYLDSARHGVGQEGGVQAGDPDCIGLVGEQLLTCMLTPSFVWKNNVMMSGGADQATIKSWYPTLTASNFVPASQALGTAPGWANYQVNGSGAYYLKTTSAFRSGGSSHATDGSDVGVDYAALQRAQGHARFVSAIPSSGHDVKINFVAPDTSSCPVDWDAQPIPTSGRSPARVADPGTTAGPRSVTITVPSAGTWYYRIQCAVEQPAGPFVAR